MSSHFHKHRGGANFRSLSSSRVKLAISLALFIFVIVLTFVWIMNSDTSIDTLKKEDEAVNMVHLRGNKTPQDQQLQNQQTSAQLIESLKKQLSEAQEKIAKLSAGNIPSTVIQQQQSTTAEATTTTKPGYIYHVNFAEGCCKTAQKRNCDMAYSKGGVDKCLMFDMSSLDKGFREKNKNILSRSRGAGYWLWKPYIMLHTMVNIAKPDDYIVYTDADSENTRSFFDPSEKIKELLDTQNIVVFPVGLPESDWTKRDAYVLMGMDTDPDVKSSWQMNAVAVIVKNTFKAQRFVGEWLTYMQDPRASTDDGNTFGLANVPGFSQHRHDQSVLSLLTKKWKLELHGLKDILANNIYGHG